MVAVSVVIPCFRAAQSIRRAMDSIAAQTSRPKEVILVDDASDDSTLHVLHQLKKSRKHLFQIKIIAQNRNQGASAARNAGWEKATQPYIAFLDADDSWHPRKLELQFKWMQEHFHVDISGHQVRIYDQQVSTVTFSEKQPMRFRKVSGANLLLRNYFCTCSVMLRRKISYRFIEEKRHGEDYLLWSEIVHNGGLAVLLEPPLALLHKAHYGEGGLSKNLAAMELGELDTYRRLFVGGSIGVFAFFCAGSFSLLRFLRRCLKVWMRNLQLERYNIIKKT